MANPEHLATVAVQSVDSVDAQCDVDLSGTAIEPTVTTHYPAIVRLIVRNAADSERKVLAGRGDRSVFSTYESDTTEPGLVLATSREAADAQPDGRGANVLAADASATEPLSLSDVHRPLAGRERVARPAGVGPPVESGRRLSPSGTYRFEERYEVVPSDGDPCRFDWGFDLSIRETDGTAAETTATELP